MNLFRFLVLATFLAAGTNPAIGQDAGGKTSPAAPPVINELNVPADGMPLAEFLASVQDREPSFQYVASAGAYQQAMVPRMHLRNVTVQQVVEMVRRLVPSVEITVEESRESPTALWIFRQIPGASGSDPSQRVSAFGLNDAVERLTMRKAWSSGLDAKEPPTPDQISAARKDAVKEVLSLVETALAQSSDQGTSPTLKFHEATGVLLVKGTSLQTNAIAQTLEALKSGEDPDQLRVKYNRLANQVQNLQARNRDLEQRAKLVEGQLMTLEKAETARRRAATQPSSAEKH
jgi:hypothetical protein